MAIGGGGHCRLLFQQWLPLPIAVPAVALNSSEGGELKLYLGLKRNTIHEEKGLVALCTFHASNVYFQWN